MVLAVDVEVSFVIDSEVDAVRGKDKDKMGCGRGGRMDGVTREV
jgi:hypothetical protein